MELITDTLQFNQVLGHASVQTSLQEDQNVPDSMPDIDKIIRRQGLIHIDSVQAATDKAVINGKLCYLILYSSREDMRPMFKLEGELRFQETIPMKGLSPSDQVRCFPELEDFQVVVLNSRKIQFQGILFWECVSKDNQSCPAGTEIANSDTPVWQQTQTVDYMYAKRSGQQVHHIRDEIAIPRSKSAVDQLLYYCLTPQNLQTRLMDDEIRLTGDLHVLVLYVPMDQEDGLESMETILAIDDAIPCPGCSEELIPDISFSMDSQLVEVRPDEHQENRMLTVDFGLNLCYELYEEKQTRILSDAYSTSCQLNLTTKDLHCQKLLGRNQGTLRLTGQIPVLQDEYPVLQICTASGQVQIDTREITDRGIALGGVVTLEILYMTDNEHTALAQASGMIPFDYVLELRDLTVSDHYQLQARIDQINVLLSSRSEMEAKVNVSFSVLASRPLEICCVTDLDTAPLDIHELESLPGIEGIVLSSDCSLWDLAKKYYTTPEAIQKLNGLESQDVKAGTRLLLVKQFSLGS